jgi:5'-phosphate synthase pdxT subunit
VAVIGVVALHGSFAEHVQFLQNLSVDVILVKCLDDAILCDAFIIPGGESTVIFKLMQENKLLDCLYDKYQDGAAIWGTCAGAIICANALKIIDVSIIRNGYGAHLSSSLVQLFSLADNKPLGMAPLIRAPVFESWGADVVSLVKDGMALAHKRCLITSFHPELIKSQAFDWHRWFVEIAMAKNMSIEVLG